MALYSITYDLVNQRDYQSLYRAIKDLCSEMWAKPTESQWIIKSSKTAEVIRNHLMNFIDNDDIIFVVEIDGISWASFNVSSGVNAWIKQNA